MTNANCTISSAENNRPLCIDLRYTYGRLYQVSLDPSYTAQYGKHARVRDPWYDRITGRHGHVSPYGGQMLAASTNHRGAVAKRLVALPYCRIVQDGDDGVTVVFDHRHLRQVARLLGARTTRTLSPERRAAFIAAGRASRFGIVPKRSR